ncbi:MAG TPA: sugar phosphate isomerase/epimerase, partial [Solirubrobacteraceae bacterium]|nr:sugar phosphate isomerase/epimerase [Solirubrobacteraceae bacterium]
MLSPREDLSSRLGLDVPKGWWPTAPMLKGLEAAGFSWVQLRTPPRAMLCDREAVLRHAGTLRPVVAATGLKIVLHGPDDLVAGDPAHDRALDGLIDYAAATGARYVVYHPAGRAESGPAEEESLRARVPRLERLGVTLAVENLAPVYPGPLRLCHDPLHVRDLVLRLASPRVGMLFDAGHANIVAGLRGTDVRSLLMQVVDA